MTWRYESAVDGVLWPAVPDYGRAALLALLHQLEQSQWWQPSDIAAAQNRQLDALLRHARDTTPFYRESWAGCYDPSAPSPADAFDRLPILSRRVLQECFDTLRSRNPPAAHGRISESRTSGSSGSPVRSLKTDISALFWNALTLRDHSWHQRDLGRKLAAIRRGSSGVAASWGTATAGLVRTGPCVMMDVDAGSEAHLAWIDRERPAYLLTYPSLAAELARASLRRGVRLDGLLEVRTLAEALPPDARALCREAWGVPLVDLYSAEEVGYIALQCPQHEHYHVQSESLLVEILDDRGAPCPPGEVGRVVVTDLHNFAMPIIRYELGDYAAFGEPCSCGRGLPVLKGIAGRVNNMLVAADGSRYWPVFGMRQAQSFVAIRQHQFVQKSFDLVEARLVVDAPLSPGQEAQLREHMTRWLPPGIRVQIVYCDSLSRSAGGKFQDFISEVA